MHMCPMQTVYISVDPCGDTADTSVIDELGKYIAPCFPQEMHKATINYPPKSDQVATLRIYLEAPGKAKEAAKRAVVVKDDDLTKAELLTPAAEVSKATLSQLTTWLSNKCFKMRPFRGAQNVMMSRYVSKLK